jgi:DNA-binding FadR family transcriptional regulator
MTAKARQKPGAASRACARGRREERARIRQLSDYDLAACLGHAVETEDFATYRAAWHEAVVVRGASGIPRY